MIQMIDIKKLHPHPDNPRKELGDLSELIESIKAQGILQNLTVVELSKYEKDYYRIVIGHRRFEAAKQAGLTELPCVIADMDYKTQVSTMLLENIQRSDLTPIEQAQGFQLMIDLGESVQGITEKTGFSNSTIRKRLNLVKLDQEKLAEAQSRGGTLQDYAELEKIKDVKLKNKVLEYIGTPNFKWQLQKAIDEEKKPERKTTLMEKLQGFASPIKDVKGLTYVTSFYDFKIPSYWKEPDKSNKSEYFYKLEEDHVTLYKKEEKPNKEISAEENAFKKKEAELKKLSKRAYEMRYAFVKDFTNVKKYAKEIQYFAFQRLLKYGYPDYDKILKLFEIEPPVEEGASYSKIEELKRNLIIEKYNKSPEKTILATAYITLEDGPSNKYYNAQSWSNFKIEYSKNETLDIIYSTLLDLGYEISDEEQKLKDGTHELFQKE